MVTVLTSCRQPSIHMEVFMGKGVAFTWSGFSPDIPQKGPAHRGHVANPWQSPQDYQSPDPDHCVVSLSLTQGGLKGIWITERR
jgi:hypothetical protein